MVVPWALPWIVSSLRINIGLALAGAIVGEFIASQQGVGRMILYAGQVMDINLVWVGVVVLSILAIVMYLGRRSLGEVRLARDHAMARRPPDAELTLSSRRVARSLRV